MQFIVALILIAIALYLLYLLIVWVILPGIGIFLAICITLLVLVMIYAFYHTLLSTMVNAVMVLRAAHITNSSRPIPTADLEGTVVPGPSGSFRIARPFRWLYREQPARALYPFDDGWFVMKEVVRRIFEPGIEDTHEWFARGRWLFAVPWHYSVRLLPFAAGAGFFIGGAMAFLFTVFSQSCFLYCTRSYC